MARFEERLRDLTSMGSPGMVLPMDQKKSIFPEILVNIAVVLGGLDRACRLRHDFYLALNLKRKINLIFQGFSKNF